MAEDVTDSEPVDIAGLRHIGVVVDDLETAMVDLGAAFGIEWTGVQQAGVRYTKSTGTGPFLELVEAKADTLWNGDWVGVQHISVRVPDLPAACRHLEGIGAEQMTRLAERHPAKGSVYYRLRSGLLLEISTNPIP